MLAFKDIYSASSQLMRKKKWIEIGELENKGLESIVSDETWSLLLFRILISSFWSFGQYVLLQVFYVELGVNTKSRTERLIWTTEVDCSIFINHDRIQAIVIITCW